jgi:hypothetical protein
VTDQKTTPTDAPAAADIDKTIVQRAHNWRSTEKAVISSTGPEKERARTKHQRAKRELAEAVDIADRRAGEKP